MFFRNRADIILFSITQTGSDTQREPGFTPSARSAEHGFTPSTRSAEHGFTLTRRSAEHGFTLTELMVVLVIIGLLATVVLINVLPSQDRAMVTKARADIATLETAMELYRLDNLAYPAPSEGLAALRSPPASLADPARYRPGGYIRALPDDPWGRPYQLQVPGPDGAPFAILSLGADGAPGGDGDNADIMSGDDS